MENYNFGLVFRLDLCTYSRSGLHGSGTGQGCDDMTSGFRLPEGIHNRALLLSNVAIVPQPGLRIDGLTYAAQNSAKKIEIIL